MDAADGRIDGRAFGAPVVNTNTNPPYGYGAAPMVPGQMYYNRKGKQKYYKASKQQKKMMKNQRRYGGGAYPVGAYPPGGY
jgi:hypothetical protein